MEFLVEFDVHVPEGTPEAEVEEREAEEKAVAGRLAQEGHLVRLWKAPVASDKTRAIGIYRAGSRAQLDELFGVLPLQAWMGIGVTPLEPHPNDPAAVHDRMFGLPCPRVTPVYRLEARLGEPLEVGETPQGRRRIVPLTGGAFTGPELRGRLIPGVSADWQTILPDGTALGDIRYTLETDAGHLLSVQSGGIRHGSPKVLAQLAQGEHVDPAEYTFRTATRIETAAATLDWLNKGIFISVAAREATGVVYETYLVT